MYYHHQLELEVLYHFVQLVTVVTRDRLDEILVSSNYHIGKICKFWTIFRSFLVRYRVTSVTISKFGGPRDA